MTLAFENVSFTYPGGETGVEDVTLTIAEGELVAVIGPSGSGKSTLLNLIAGFLRPSSGHVAIAGRPLTTEPPEARTLGIVFQHYAFFPHMTLAENVAYPLKLRGVGRAERRAQAVGMLERVGMAGRADAYPAALSGGQQQRVALARALVFRPHGLLLDEPLSALDANLRVEMRDEILRVQREAGIATLLVTHDQEEALSVADRIAVMRDGRLIQVGRPADLYERPVDAEVAAFVGQSNLWPGRVTAPGRIETALGPMACDTGTRAAGEQITAFVRPERITALGPDETREGDLNGPVLADRYLGPIRRIDLAIGSGTLRLETHLRTQVTAARVPVEAIHLLPAPTHL